jgi:hypothetical protein
MKSLAKYALPLVTVLSSGLGLVSPAFAQSDYTQELIDGMDQITRDMQRFNEIAERQNALRGPCNNGNQRACAEIQQLDRELQRMTQH